MTITRVKKGKTSLRKVQEDLTAARMELIDSKNKSEHQAAMTKVEEIEKELNSRLTELESTVAHKCTPNFNDSHRSLITHTKF